MKFLLPCLGFKFLWFKGVSLKRVGLYACSPQPCPSKKGLGLRATAAIPNAKTVVKTKANMLSKICLSILFLGLTPAIAQKKYNLTIKGLTNQNKINYVSNFNDSLLVINEVDSVINILKFNGYFTCLVDKFEWQNQNLTVNLTTGNLYNFTTITNGNINPNAFSFKKQSKNQKFNIVELKHTYNNILKWYENNGYPFAQVWLDSFTFNQHNISAKLYCQPNNKFTIDSVTILGSAKLSVKYLLAALDIKIQDNYQEDKIRLIDKRLKSLSFINVEKNTEIVFEDDRAKINLFINQKNANQFDGIIGFLPATNGTKTQFTGDFKLKLQNTLKRGELIDFNYRGLPNQTQQLIAKINYPYIFRSKIGLDLDFQLFKKDTSFLNLNTKLGFAFAFTPEKLLKIFVENYKGNLISLNNNTITNTLPLFTNIATTFYGIGTNLEKTNNTLLPTKGYKIIFNASIGQRQINKSNNINSNDFLNLTQNSTQYKLDMDFNYYVKVTSKFGLRLQNQAALISGNSIFENEAYRIGGFKILRGFNEQSIIVSSYMVQTLETRYFIEKSSYLFAFYDQGLIKQSFATAKKTDSPAGLGVGINFETKLGSMSLMYALGKQQNNPLNLRTGKIHFGLVSYF